MARWVPAITVPARCYTRITTRWAVLQVWRRDEDGRWCWSVSVARKETFAGTEDTVEAAREEAMTCARGHEALEDDEERERELAEARRDSETGVPQIRGAA